MESNEERVWWGVDLDGTLAHYYGWVDCDVIGAPIPAMVAKIKGHLAKGDRVKIFTARVCGLLSDSVSHWKESKRALHAIERYSQEHLGQVLEVTCIKDLYMIGFYDDRAIQVVPNTGLTLEEHYGQL